MNPKFNAGDEFTSAQCAFCGFVVWTERADHNVLCQCGAVYITGGGLHPDSPTRGLSPVPTETLQTIYDYEYADDQTDLVNPQESVAVAWREYRLTGGNMHDKDRRPSWR